LALFFLLACLYVIYKGTEIVGTPPLPSSWVSNELHEFVKSGAWRGPAAVLGYEMVAAWLAIIFVNPFIANRLLAGSILGYWLCLSETILSTFGMAYVAIQRGMPALHDSNTLLILLPIAALTYLLMPGVRKKFF